MADNVTQKSPKSVDKSKFCNVIHRTTSETLRLGETDTAVNNSNLLTTTSSGTPTALAGCNQRKKPCSSFQITSVIVGRMNNDGGDDSADDLDESHADDISDVVDNSRITDNETPSYSEDTYSKEDVFFNVSNSSLCSAPVIPTSSQYGLAIVSPGAHNNVVAGTVTAVNNNILNTNNNNNVPVNVANIDSNLTIMNHSSELDASVNPTKLHEPAEIEDMQAKPGRNDRFKVVKIESTEPFKRGRWMCMDYLDHTINTQFVQQPIVSSKNESIVHPTVQYVSGTTDSNNSTASVESTMQRQQQQPQMQHQVAAQQQSTKSMPVQQMQQQQAQTPYYQQQSQSGVVSSQPPVAQYPQQQYVQQQTQVVTQQQRAVQQTQPQQYAQQQQPQHVPQQQHVQQQHVQQQQQQHVQQQQQYVQQPQHNVVQQQQLVQPQVIAQPQQTHVQQQVPIQQHAQQPHMQQNVPQHQMQQQQMTNKAREQTQPQSNSQMGMVQPAMIPSQTSTSSTSIYNPGQSYTPAQQQQPYISQSYTGQQQMYGSNIQGQSTQVSTSGQSYSGLQSYSQGQSCSNVPTQGQSYLPTQGQSYSGQPTVPAQVQSFPSQAQSYSQPYIPLSQPTTQGYVAQKGSLSTPVYSQPNIGSQSQTYTVSMPSSPASIPHQPVYPTTTIANQSQTYIQQKPSGQSQPNATNPQYANQAYSVQYSASQPGLSTSQSYVHVPQHSHSAVNTSAYGTPQYKTTPADGPSPSDTQQHQVEPGVETPSAADDTALVPVTEETDAAASSNAVAIDNKIEQAMDLVKSHLMFAVREEVEVLKERIAELMDRINQLETENSILKAHASQEVLAQLTMPTSQTYNIQPNVVPAVVSAGAAVAAVAAVAVSAAQIVSVPSPGQAPPTN